MASSAMVVPVIIVVIIPPWLAPEVTAMVVVASAMEALALGVWCPVALDELSAGLAVRRATDPTTPLKKGEVFHYLKVVAQNVDMAALEFNRVVMVRRHQGEWDGGRWKLPV